MHQIYTIIALDLANERARAAREARWTGQFSDERPSVLRRGLAQALAAVSRGSAAAARRLDAVSADDLGRTLAPTK